MQWTEEHNLHKKTREITKNPVGETQEPQLAMAGKKIH